MKKLLLLLLPIALFMYAKPTLDADYDIKPELFWLEESSISFDLTLYNAIYYEPISNQYYLATTHKTNNISYNTNNIVDEKNYIEYKMPSPKSPLTYVGSIDLTNRIYIDNNKNLYVKKLELIIDRSYDVFGETNILTSPVYPYTRHYDGDGGDIYKGVRYKNKDVDFFRHLFRNGELVQTCGG